MVGKFPETLTQQQLLSTRPAGFVGANFASLGPHSWRMMLVRDLRDESERQYKSRKRDNPHRLLYTTMDQIRKTMPDGLPTGV
jgi:hypothetical protein